jgi:hypothetical protein
MPPLHRPFYEAAAQVLPVLVLVMAVGELRLRAESKDGLFGFLFPLLTMASMLFAELAAFAALAGGDGSSVIAVIVLLGLMFGCIFLLIQFALVLGDEAIEKHSRLYALIPVFVAGIAMFAVLGGGLLIYLEAR